MADQIEDDGSLTVEHLHKYAAYRKQLRAWFRTRHASPVAEDATALLQKVHCSVCTIEEAAQMILGDPVAPTPSRDLKTKPATPPEPKLRDIVRDPATIDREKSRLKLESSFERLLLVTKQDVASLSEYAIELLATYLRDNNIELNAYQLRQFQANVKRWILATPERQVLELRIGPYQLEPYSSYVRLEE